MNRKLRLLYKIHVIACLCTEKCVGTIFVPFLKIGGKLFFLYFL